MLNEILERGVSPDGQSAEFLLWRLDTADASTEYFIKHLIGFMHASFGLRLKSYVERLFLSRAGGNDSWKG